VLAQPGQVNLSFDGITEAIVRRVVHHHNMYQGRFPASGDQHGYQVIGNDSWLASFWPGMLWLAYAAGGAAEARASAEVLLPSFEERLDRQVHITHDLGFLFTLSARAQWQLTGADHAYALALRAARELQARFRPRGGYIQAWGPVGDPDEGGRIIIDCLMNLPLLFWAAEQTGDPTFAEAARSHAEQSLRHLVRADGSTAHTFFFDQENGAPLGARTHQGYADTSLWARGQAWAIYGFALAAEWTGEEHFRLGAERAAARMIAELPPDRVPLWDLRLPPTAPHYRDSSAGAIAAGGLLRLAKLRGDDPGDPFRVLAGELLTALIDCCYESAADAQGLLRHGCLHAPKGWAVDNALILGDYFFFEALLLHERRAPDLWGPSQKVLLAPSPHLHDLVR
jgi:unsaturated chondroitin disaccharide hydrolase